jgi:ubiquinone/menaquinone biosynthesis C-methylase UbiE
MRRLDYILRDWRYRIVEPYIPEECEILDIGGFDGSFLRQIYHKINKGVCIDPLIEGKKDGKIEFIKHRILDKIPFPDSSFDVVTMLAVYEHLSNRELITAEVFRILKDNGCVLLTIPSSKVDFLLKLLLKIRLIDGISTEEHKHFDVSNTVKIFEMCGFKFKKWSKFQIGLNNLFIFEK